jgi:hypothetical protein
LKHHLAIFFNHVALDHVGDAQKIGNE